MGLIFSIFEGMELFGKLRFREVSGAVIGWRSTLSVPGC